MLRDLVPTCIRRRFTPDMAASLIRMPLVGLPLSVLIWGKALRNLRKDKDCLIYKYSGRDIRFLYEGFPSLLYVFTDSIYKDNKIRPYPGDTIVDIGAYVGAYSVKTWETYLEHSGKIICVEPCSHNLLYLKENVRYIPNLRIITKAVGSKLDRRPFFTKGMQSGFNSYRNKVRDLEYVEVDTLHSLLGEEKVDFIKINVGPSDIYDVILGCKDVLLRNDVKLSAAVGWYVIHKLGDIKRVQNLLKEWNYSSYLKGISLYSWKEKKDA